jgi:hypothetical protein
MVSKSTRPIFKISAIAMLFVPVSVLAQNIDCSVIKNNTASLERCLQGQREARAAARARENALAREARIREAANLAKNVGVACASRNLGRCAKEAVRPNRAE